MDNFLFLNHITANYVSYLMTFVSNFASDYIKLKDPKKINKISIYNDITYLPGERVFYLLCIDTWLIDKIPEEMKDRFSWINETGISKNEHLEIDLNLMIQKTCFTSTIKYYVKNNSIDRVKADAEGIRTSLSLLGLEPEVKIKDTIICIGCNKLIDSHSRSIYDEVLQIWISPLCEKCAEEKRNYKNYNNKNDRENALQTQRLKGELTMLKRKLAQLKQFEDRSLSQGGVFISHSHPDKDIVEKIINKFKKEINYWVDDKDILVGQDIDKEISKGIQNNLLFLIVLTPTSINSKWIERELNEASHEEIGGKKVILPVLAKGLDPALIPARLRRKLYADVYIDFNEGYEKIKKAIVAYIKEHDSDKGGKVINGLL